MVQFGLTKALDQDFLLNEKNLNTDLSKMQGFIYHGVPENNENVTQEMLCLSFPQLI